MADPGPLAVLDLLPGGPVSYADGLALQRARVAARQAGTVPDALILLEHTPVVSYGRMADPAHRLVSDAEFAAAGIELVATDRGGDATYHGPGQLVGYPVLHLGDGNRDLHRYVRGLEETLIRAAADLGVPDAHRVDFHAGVWIGDGYLAAIGVKVSRWVTHHGFALNVDDRVRAGFATIVPCGVPGKRVVTLSEAAGRIVTPAEAAVAVARRFAEVFGYRDVVTGDRPDAPG